jgi:hypothetical protein
MKAAWPIFAQEDGSFESGENFDAPFPQKYFCNYYAVGSVNLSGHSV